MKEYLIKFCQDGEYATHLKGIATVIKFKKNDLRLIFKDDLTMWVNLLTDKEIKAIIYKINISYDLR